MLSAERAGLLQSFLGSLPLNVAARLAKVVEVDKLTDGTGLPHEMILESLRPVLRKGEAPQRTPAPLRLFCRPFEDLLVSAPRKEKQKGRIARSSVAPVWNWLGKTLLPQETKAFTACAKAHVLAWRLDDAAARAGDFWPLAGEALRAAIARDHKSARAALGGELALADAEEIALLLLAGRQMTQIQALMPKPVPALNEEILWGLRKIYDEVVEVMLDASPYVPVVAMQRLAKPWEVLRLAMQVTRQSQDTLVSQTDMGLSGDLLFADIENRRAAVHSVRHPDFDVDVLLAHLSAFTELSLGLVKEMDIRRDGKWGQRLLKDRAAVGSVMEGFMERAPKEIAAALPMHKAGFTGGSRVPDFSRQADPEKTQRALRYAKLLAGCRTLAAPASFGAKLAGAMDEAMQTVRSYNEDLVKEMRSAQGPRREIVEHQFQTATELTALLFGEEETEFLRRRGKAALAAAA